MTTWQVCNMRGQLIFEARDGGGGGVILSTPLTQAALGPEDVDNLIGWLVLLQESHLEGA